MNEIVNRFLLSEDIFMPKIHLRQTIFTYSTYGTFTKNKEEMKKIRSRRFKVYLSKRTR